MTWLHPSQTELAHHVMCLALLRTGAQLDQSWDFDDAGSLQFLVLQA